MSARKVVGLLLLMSALGACSDSPRNKQQLVHASDQITWAGREVTPNVDYLLMIGDGSQSPLAADIIASAKTAATVSNTDAAGTNWYGWSQTLTLPGDPRLWKVKSPHVIEATMRTMAYAGMFDASRRTPLTTFDFGSTTDTCIQDNQSGGGAQIMDKCKSPTSGVVKVTAPCGTKGEVCCPVSANWLSDPNSCDSSLKCSFAGGLGDCRVPEGGACSKVSDCVYTANACVNGVCKNQRPLGGSCSTLSDCKAPATSCTGGRCTVANGASCGANDNCESGICKSGVCSIDCTPNAACTVSGKVGACAAGKWSCTATTKTCTQTVQPSKEICDKVDNDCDGSKDEDNVCCVPNAACTVPGQTGACAAGKQACTTTSTTCVQKVSPSTEVCDGVDNDCDGSKDEGNVCAPKCAALGTSCGSMACCLSGGGANNATRCVQGVCMNDPQTGGQWESCDWPGEWCCSGVSTSSMSCASTDVPGLKCNAGTCGF